MFYRLKRLIPKAWIQAYHLAMSWMAAVWYDHPSEKMIVIGVTGTSGKTTTSYLIAKALEASGKMTACSTTSVFKIGEREWLNEKKMTMLGRFALQKFLHQAYTAGCRFAVIETSSQGIVQHRHRQIHYDALVLTNLYPEHIEAHGSFEAYKNAKIEVFRHLAAGKRKEIYGKEFLKTVVLPSESPHAKDFIVSGLDRVIWNGVGPGEGIRAANLEERAWSTAFTVQGHRTEIHLPGVQNVENALAAIAATTAFDLSLEVVLKHLDGVKGLPGRFERIECGQPFTVMVDYAFEPVALEKLYETLSRIPHGRILHVLGSCGGGRDVARRPILGRLAGKWADIVIVTNEDPYDDDPELIMQQVADGAKEFDPQGLKVSIIPDRRRAIESAIRQARPGDLVLLTGKGAEQAMILAKGRRLPWDERQVAMQAIQSLFPKNL